VQEKAADDGTHAHDANGTGDVPHLLVVFETLDQQEIHE